MLTFLIFSELVKEYWDHNKSTVANLQAMGLSANPNANMKIKPLQPFTPQPTIIEEPAIRKPQVLKSKQIFNFMKIVKNFWLVLQQGTYMPFGIYR